ncbi:class I SAM-dependent methyltransferase [Amycolatopsis anabasis]|uniref:class I SAM-dependent methyltransferase n=1 Tax=Amycolatopsis anabasis TaxID=1840409 RepID=UPI00131E0C8B|nr:class I SAM-dependent methyltransferase [Amycolatopsis anabasis]
MLAKLRDLLRAEALRKAMRDKTMHAVEEVLRPMHDEQLRRIEQLERVVADLRTEHEAQSRRVFDRLIEFEIRSRRDIVYAADREAARESNRFVREHMPTAPHFAEPVATLEHALSLAPGGGMALEFGVYTGGTLKVIATARPEGGVYGFDSFEGLPENWRNGFPAGTFSVDGLPDVPGAELVVGWFDETLPDFLAAHPGPVDFLHVDGDLYSSAKTVLDQVGPRLRPGSVILFDEFFNFPGWQGHEARAWHEYVERTGIEFSYEGYTYANEQVVVRVLET